MMHTPTLTLERISDTSAVLRIDDVAETMNTLKHTLMDELDSVLVQIESDLTLKTVIFMSGKPNSFIAGADIGMLKSVINAEEAARLADLLHTATNRLKRLPATTVAAINGPCLGGGLELALAFDYRVASNDPRDTIGPAGGSTRGASGGRRVRKDSRA